MSKKIKSDNNVLSTDKMKTSSNVDERQHQRREDGIGEGK